MCSLAECDLPCDDNASQCSVDTEKSSNSALCKKCRVSDAELTLRTKDRYCRQCFVVAVTHKFRATLAKNRSMRHNDNVVVDFDGGQNSIAIMKLINSSLDEKNVKVSFIIYVIICSLENVSLPLSCHENVNNPTYNNKDPRAIAAPSFLTQLERKPNSP